MTKKALKLLFVAQAKSACWFVGIYALVMAILLLVVLLFAATEDTSWISISSIYAPKIYLLVMGIVYPLSATKLYVSMGLTRKQFFWAYTGAISIVSLFLLILILASTVYEQISVLFIVTHYLQLLLFLLIGWCSILGFQMRRWYTSILGIVCAIAIFHSITTIPGIIDLSELAAFGWTVSLLSALFLILPRLTSRIPLKG